MKRLLRLGIIGLLFLALIGVRVGQHALFYDPLISFFHGEFKLQPLPDLSIHKYLVFIFLRYLINALISLAVLYLAFRSLAHLKFALFIYGVIGLASMIALSWFLVTNDPENHMPLFYVRRILIHPLLLVILLPAFYFQERINQRQEL